MFQARGVEPFVTTVGQLNFFRWFIEKEILDFITANREAIEKDMNSTLKQHYTRSNSTVSTVHTAAESVPTADSTISINTVSTSGKSPRKKRCELTQSAMKKVNVHECEVVVNFC
jgi:hypothetical protein